MMTRIGGASVFIVRIWTGDVWVRNTFRSPLWSGCRKKVSCISRAG
jgi:hypothetical protein